MVAITVRDIPDDVRDELAARAARAGQSLQEYPRGLLVHIAAKPARARVRTTGSRLDAATILAAKRLDRR